MRCREANCEMSTPSSLLIATACNTLIKMVMDLKFLDPWIKVSLSGKTANCKQKLTEANFTINCCLPLLFPVLFEQISVWEAAFINQLIAHYYGSENVWTRNDKFVEIEVLPDYPLLEYPSGYNAWWDFQRKHHYREFATQGYCSSLAIQFRSINARTFYCNFDEIDIKSSAKSLLKLN